jgi:phosphomannomutase
MTESLPVLVGFDLDDTLAPSKSRIAPPIVDLLGRLLERTEVAVISGGQFGQFLSQLIEPLGAYRGARLSQLHVMPACGTQYYRFADSLWQRIYLQELTADEKERSFECIESAARELGFWSETTWGPSLEDRESQVTFSALGQNAPLDAKAGWDPTGEKKHALRDAVAVLVPDLEVRAGGSTSIDVTRHGRDKGYGMEQLLAATGHRIEDLLYFGDQLEPGGNDYPVRALGVRCIPVNNWHDTERQLTSLMRSPGFHQS